MENTPKSFKEKDQEKKKRDHYLIAQGGLIQVAKRYLNGKGTVFPDGPMIVGLMIDGVERLASLPEERVAAIRNLGFLAMNKKIAEGDKKEEEKIPVRVKQFYQNRSIDPNLNL